MPSFQRRLQTPLARPAHICTHKLLYTATKVQPESTQCKISSASSNSVKKRLARISSIFILLVSNDILPVSGIILPVSGSVTASFGCHDYTQVGNVGLLTVGEHKSPQVAVSHYAVRLSTTCFVLLPLPNTLAAKLNQVIFSHIPRVSNSTFNLRTAQCTHTIRIADCVVDDTGGSCSHSDWTSVCTSMVDVLNVVTHDCGGATAAFTCPTEPTHSAGQDVFSITKTTGSLTCATDANALAAGTTCR